MAHARKIGLDLKRFEADLVDADTAKAMQSDMDEVKAIGVTGTPGFFINGRYLSGAKPFEEFAKKINAELRAKKQPVPPEVADL